jgi:hypothetical protein
MLFTFWIDFWKSFWEEPETKEPLWEMDFYETYHTKTQSSKMSRKEAEEECFKLFNIHAKDPVRVKLDATIRKLKP